MSLSKPNTTAAATAQFETEEVTNMSAATEAVQAQATEASVAATVTAATDSIIDAAIVITDDEKLAAEAVTTAVAVQKPAGTALAVAGQVKSHSNKLADANHLHTLKDSLPVTWEDFSSIQANQGEFGVKGDGGKSLGKNITLRMVSFQDLFVSSPHDMDAQGEELVKYSDDGIVAHDGTLIVEHQASLKEQGFENAGIDHKMVLVGELDQADGDVPELLGELVQVVLPDTGRRAFTSHTKASAYQIANGRLTQEDSEYIKLTAAIAGTGNKKFTKVSVTYAAGHEAKKPTK